MRVLPHSRARRAVLAFVIALLAIAIYALWDKVLFGVNLALPGPAYSHAKARTSDAAQYSHDDVPLAHPVEATGPTGTDPSIALARLLELDGPSAVADPPGPGPVLVTTLDGRVHLVDLDAGTERVVLDVARDITTGGERGLLGIAIDPKAERVYLDYTNRKGDTEIRSWPLRDGVPVGGRDDGVLHLQIGKPFPNHNGGNLVFGPDGALWIGTGDGGGAGDRGNVAQDPDSLLGKMLRVVPDPAGGVRALRSNHDWGGRPEIWAIGLRNPWRYTFDRATHRLWVGDVGQNTIEEVSVADPDDPTPNFGWSVVEGANSYKGDVRRDFVEPVVTYEHGTGACSVTGGYVYRGESIASLYGWYVFADYCAGWIHAVAADAPSLEPVELATEVGPVVSFAELEDGELLVLTSSAVLAVRAGR
jgi:glucose/arabinose dehydrogenase